MDLRKLLNKYEISLLYDICVNGIKFINNCYPNREFVKKLCFYVKKENNLLPFVDKLVFNKKNIEIILNKEAISIYDYLFSLTKEVLVTLFSFKRSVAFDLYLYIKELGRSEFTLTCEEFLAKFDVQWKCSHIAYHLPSIISKINQTDIIVDFSIEKEKYFKTNKNKLFKFKIFPKNVDKN